MQKKKSSHKLFFNNTLYLCMGEALCAVFPKIVSPVGHICLLDSLHILLVHKAQIIIFFVALIFQRMTATFV